VVHKSINFLWDLEGNLNFPLPFEGETDLLNVPSKVTTGTVHKYIATNGRRGPESVDKLQVFLARLWQTQTLRVAWDKEENEKCFSS